MRIVNFITGILGASLFVLASVVGGLQIEGYNAISQYISESYATGIPNSEYLRYIFVASGFLLALFGFTAPFVLRKSKGVKIGFFLFALFYGLGTALTGFFPCDLGCDPEPEKASLSQFIHNASGFLVYTIVPFCLMGIGFSTKKMTDVKNLPKVSLICGVLAFGFVVLLFGNPTGPFKGLFQRIIESSILFWVIYTALYLQKRKNNNTL